jgi:hypothetical protein
MTYEWISGLSVRFVPSEHISLGSAMFRLVASLVATEVLPRSAHSWKKGGSYGDERCPHTAPQKTGH